METTDIGKKLHLSKFLEKLEVCHDKFYGYDATIFRKGYRFLKRAKSISGAVNFIMGREKVDVSSNTSSEHFRCALQ